MSYLRYLCLFAHSGVKHILCCLFVLFFFVLWALCYPFLWIVFFLIAPSVFSIVYIILGNGVKSTTFPVNMLKQFPLETYLDTMQFPVCSRIS
jgi:hypothetical protein